ncbi:MAG: phytase [Vicinamibacterales bacterium]
MRTLSVLCLAVAASTVSHAQEAPRGLAPSLITAAVPDDADDPAVWIDREDPARSLILGTNKVAEPGGALYVYGLDGQARQVLAPLDRPNNVDVEYALATPDGPIDIAVVTERLRHRLRVYQVRADGLTAIDDGGIPVLEGQSGEAAEPMGLALYRRPADGAVFAIVAPKTGDATNYLWQYRLTFDPTTRIVVGSLVRRFGNFSGRGEIEAVAVDDAAGVVYFSDEEFAVRVWRADPDAGDARAELATFGRGRFAQQREGIALAPDPAGDTLVVVSDQVEGGSTLRLFQRSGDGDVREAGAVLTQAASTDGIEFLPGGVIPRFPMGAVIMMNSTGRNFHVYDWRLVLAAIGRDLTHAPARQARPKLVAHRGASAYAPEHTLAAYRIAIEQGADYVEQDLAVTRDGVLICLHDDTLERTTNVEEVFPDRAVAEPSTGRRQWYAADFTLSEIKTLDAGSWFDSRFAGERVPTWEEAVQLVSASAGLYPELKSPPLYRARGIDMVGVFVQSLPRLGLDHAPVERLIVQSFDPEALIALTAAAPGLARTLLIDPRQASRWFTPAGMVEARRFATGVGPSKLILDGRPELVKLAHAAGLTVTPYTFTSRAPGRGGDVTAEMAYFLRELNVDALFTDNPDRFPR